MSDKQRIKVVSTTAFSSDKEFPFYLIVPEDAEVVGGRIPMKDGQIVGGRLIPADGWHIQLQRQIDQQQARIAALVGEVERQRVLLLERALRPEVEWPLAYVVARRRNELGLTQHMLADRAGVTRSWLGHVETGYSPRPEPELLAKVAPVLGIPLDELLRERPTTIVVREAVR